MYSALTASEAMKKYMYSKKTKIGKLTVCAVAMLCMASIFAGCGTETLEKLSDSNIRGRKTTENDTERGDYKLYLENEQLQLYMNPDTTELYVINKADGSQWDTSGITAEGNDAGALLGLSYLESDGTVGRLDSFQNSVADGQYKIETKNNMLTVHYSIGTFSSAVMVPEVISSERYKELYNNLEDDFDRMKFENYYYYIDPDKLSGEDSDYVKRYPILKKKAMYAVNESVLTSSNIKSEFSEILNSAGYTSKMYEEDIKNFSGESREKKEPGFNISIEFLLDGNRLKVTVPNDSIEMYSEYPLLGIELMKYFGSPDKSENGYFLLPDGSGSVMNFYNGKGAGHPYSVRIYGTGYSLATNEKVSNYYNASLPLYGIKRNGSAVLAEITSGAAVAEINAYPGDESERAYASADFTIRETYIQTLASGKKESSTIVQKQRATCDFSETYTFLSGTDADYNGMAKVYRNELFKSSDKSAENILVAEYIGMVSRRAQKFGISYLQKNVMTSFDDAYNLTKSLCDAGLENISVRFIGWFGGGIAHTTVKNAVPESKLGGEKGLERLKSRLDEMNIALYPDADIQHTNSSDSKNAIRMINKSVGTTYGYELASFEKEPFQISRIVNNGTALTAEAKALCSLGKKEKLSNISVRGIGNELNADYRETAPCDYSAAAEQVALAAKKLSGKYGIMTDGANAYLLNYIKNAVNVPLTSNEYDITDYSVPFLQQVIHGYIGYTGSALNLSGDFDLMLLESARSGAGLYITTAAQNNSVIVNSDYENLFSTDFNRIMDGYKDKLQRYQKELASTVGKCITDFRYLSEGVSQTAYENGTRVIVNTSDADYFLDGIMVKTLDYAVIVG